MQRRAGPSARRVATLVVAVVAALGLSGCFKASQTVNVRADGTGTVALHAEINKKALAALVNGLGGAAAGGAPAQTLPFRLVDRTFPDGTRVHTTDAADRSVFDASFAFNGPDDYVHKMGEIDEAASTDPGTGSEGGSLLVRRAGDQVELVLDLGTTSGVGDVELSTMRDVLASDAQPSATVTVTMPGSIVASNGNARGRTVSWDLLTERAPSRLLVTSRIAAAGLPSWAVPVGIGVAVALVLVLALVGLLLSRRRRHAGEAHPVAPPQPGPAAGAGPAGTFFPAPGGLPPREPVGSAGDAGGSPWAPEAAEPWSPAPAPAPGAPPPPPRPLPPPWETMVATPPPPLVHPVAEEEPAAIAESVAPPPPPDPPVLSDRPEAAPPRLSVWGPKPLAIPDPPAAVVAERVAPESKPTEIPQPPPAVTAAEDLPWRMRAGGKAPVPPPTEAGPEVSPWRMPGGAEEAVSPAAEPVPEVLPWRMPGGSGDPEPPAPPPPPAPAGPPAGWYADPAGGGGIRYWDGSTWTNHTR
ncbi:MAG: DUF2510 domain-containing protein [Acidimicrobiales bacterium]